MDVNELYKQIRDLGHEFDPRVMVTTRELFRPFVEQAPFARREVISNVRYGNHERQVIDLYKADRPNAPVLLFVHGGGFVAGDKDSDGTFYNNVGRYFAANGYLAVSMNYRLAPDAVWPAGSEDTASVLAWLVEHAAEYGGDPERIVIVGQSAGASHSAGVLFDTRFSLPPAVKAAALLSGFYQAAAPLAGGPLLYFGSDESAWDNRSPATHVAAGHVPVMLSIAENDPAVIADQTLVLARELTRVDGHPPLLRCFEGQNHVSGVHGFGIGEDPVGTEILSFFAKFI